MNGRPDVGHGLFYHRDSEGHSDLAPPQYVVWRRVRRTGSGSPSMASRTPSPR